MNNLICGHSWEDIQRAQQGGKLGKPVELKDGDYGCDPLGNGMFKMVPSGDIVNGEEKSKRLA